jgi:hypothetical protein
MCSRRANDSEADYFAESGLQFAIDQLVRSEFGADWRPIPDNITNPDDPDFFWLKPYNPADGTGGFTRINCRGWTRADSRFVSALRSRASPARD